MNDKQTLVKDPLFQGVTRPAMLMGVTYEAFVVNFLATAISFLASGQLKWLLICLPIHALCFLVCARDARYFGLIALWLRTGGRSKSRILWGASSASPLPFRKGVANARFSHDLRRRH